MLRTLLVIGAILAELVSGGLVTRRKLQLISDGTPPHMVSIRCHRVCLHLSKLLQREVL